MSTTTSEARAANEAAAIRLAEARASGIATDPPSATIPDLSLERSYEIQARLVELETAGPGGPRVAGFKAGLIDPEARRQAGLEAPIFGVLYDEAPAEPDSVRPAPLIAPKLEAEIAVVLGPCGRNDAKHVAPIESLHVAVELADSRSRWRDGLADIVADRSAGCTYAIGPAHSPELLEGIDGELVSVVALGLEEQARLSRDLLLEVLEAAKAWIATIGHASAGAVLLTGNLLPAVDAEPGGGMSVRSPLLGSVSMELE